MTVFGSLSALANNSSVVNLAFGAMAERVVGTPSAIFVSLQPIMSTGAGDFHIVNVVIVDSPRTILNDEAHASILLLERDFLPLPIKVDGGHTLSEKPVWQRNRYLTVSDACQFGNLRTIGNENATVI